MGIAGGVGQVAEWWPRWFWPLASWDSPDLIPAEIPESGRDRLSPKQNRGFGSGLLFLLVVLAPLFSPWIFSGRVLAPLDILTELYQPWRANKGTPEVHNHFVTDAVTQYLPYRLLFHDAIRAEGGVGWNPLIFGGTAQHANTMLVCHEVTLQLHRFLDFWTAWNLGRWLQFLVAGTGMLVFLQSRKAGLGSAVFGATAFMLNHQFVAWIYFNQIVAAFCWVPWILWALFHAREGSPRFGALAATGIGLGLLGATLQQAAFLAAVLACLGLGWWWEDRHHPCRWIRTIALLFAAGLVGAGLAAFALEPNITAFWENAQAGHHRGQLGYDYGFPQPWLNLLVSPFTGYPFLFGSVQTLDLWKLFRLDLFFIGFFGTLPMGIAWVALFSRKVPLAAKAMMVCGVVIPLTPLVGYLYHRFNVVWIVGGCWAAGAWLAATDDARIRQWQLRWRGPLVAFVGVWMLVSLCLVVGRGWLEPWLQSKVLSFSSTGAFGHFTGWMQDRAARLIGYLCIWNPWQLVGLAGLLLSFWGLAWIRKSSPAALVAALGVALQLSVFWWQWTTWSQPRLPYGQTPLEQLLKHEVGTTGRLAMDPPSRGEIWLPPNTLMPAGVAITGGYDAMHPNGMRSPTGFAWDFPGTTHFLGKISGPIPKGWELVWQDGRRGLWRNPSPVGGRVYGDDLFSPALLPLENLTRPTANTLRVRLPAGASGAELFSNWRRGWFWRPQGETAWQPAELGENRTIKLYLPKPLGNEAAIELRYDPSPPSWAVVISAISLGVIFLWGFRGRGYGRVFCMSSKP